MKLLKRIIPAVIAVAVAAEPALVSNIRMSDSAERDLNAVYESIVVNGMNYIYGLTYDNGSVGDDRTVNDTADALYIARMLGKEPGAGWLDWANSKWTPGSTDSSARMALATNDWDKYVTKIVKEQQNPDGGFGLSAGYTSDVLDTVLIGEYIASLPVGDSWIPTYGVPLTEYLLSAEESDGTWAYNSTSRSSDVLTAMVVYTVDTIQRKACANAHKDYALDERLEKPVGYLRSSAPSSFDDEHIEAALWRSIALLSCDGRIDKQKTISALEAAQKSDGSFGESVHVTMLALDLLRNTSPDKSTEIFSCKTSLSAENGIAGDGIKAHTDITYAAENADRYEIRLTVTNGETEVYTDKKLIDLAPEKGTAESDIVFPLLETEDNGITVTVDLMHGEQLASREIFDVTLGKSPEITPATSISGFSLDLSQDSVICGVPAEVTASANVLYATNVDDKAQIKVSFYDGDELKTSNTVDVALLTENTAAAPDLLNVKLDIDGEGAENKALTFKAELIYNDKVIFKDEKKVSVIRLRERTGIEPVTEPTDPTDPTDPTEPTTEPPTEPEKYLDIQWGAPLISELMLYAGNDSDISASAALIYDSNYDFNGTLSVKAVRNKETIAEKSMELSLPAQDLNAIMASGDKHLEEGQFAELPMFTTKDLITFTATEKGKTKVTLTVSDAEGNAVFTASRTVEVIEKPRQDLVLYSEKSKDGSSVSFRWNNVSSEGMQYTYTLKRREKGGKWETRPIWNEADKIKVLNIYPNYAPVKEGYTSLLEMWMKEPLENEDTPADKDLFDIGTVYIDNFNSEPETYLKDEAGKWKYDVLFFGSWDCNARKDLSEASYKTVQEFADSGRGVLFGHDTICVNFGHYNFVKFAPQLGIKVVSDTRVIPTNSVSVIKLGTLTNYPWTIRGTLTIPSTHTYGQYIGGPYDATEWMELNAEHIIDDEGAHSNFYLASKNNLAMIQTGHSDGAASDDERKVLANTIFYLYQRSRSTTAKDASFYDLAAPDAPTAKAAEADGAVSVTASSKDNGTTYEYRILAAPEDENSTESIASNVETHTALSGLAGFAYVITPDEEPAADLLPYDENHEHVTGITAANKKGSATIKITPGENDYGYIHIFAIDNADNVSSETVLPLSQKKLTAEIKTDKLIYAPGEKVSITADTLVETSDLTAEMQVDILDEADNPTAVIAEPTEQQLTAGKTFTFTGEWAIPEDTVGRYKAVITWKKSGKVIARAAAAFKVTGDTSVNDNITSDKRVYTLADPVNLRSVVFNNSTSLVENDLVLNVTVYDSNNKAVKEFTKELCSMNPKASIDYASAIPPQTLTVGEYMAVAKVLQDNAEVASDETSFTVETKKAAPEKTYYVTGELTDGFYFNHDTRPFGSEHIAGLSLFEVTDGNTKQTDFDLTKLTIKDTMLGMTTPQDVFDERISSRTYDIGIYYNGKLLSFDNGEPAVFKAYIGVKGDTNFDNKADAADATNILKYYSLLSTGGDTENTLLFDKNTAELDELAAFLADVDLDIYSEGNRSLRKKNRQIMASDASSVLKFYAYMSTGVTDRNVGWDKAVNGRKDAMTKLMGGN